MAKDVVVAEKVEVKVSPSALIELAISKGADLEKLEKLLTLQERYDAMEANKAYNKAMSEFKAHPPKIDKDKKVSFNTSAGKTSYNHASLANVTEKINGELSKYGLSASWSVKQNGTISVTCKITHVKGHSEETTLTAAADTSGSKNSIQAIGSTLSYLERYSLLALCGLATFDSDDDGAGVVESIDDTQNKQIEDLIALKQVDVKKFCKAFKIEEVMNLPKDKFQQAITMLNAKVVK
jgi:hypothetical protein